MIVIDDNSNDQTLEIAIRLSLKYNNLVILKNITGVKGSASARNIGIKAAQSEFIAFLDADDFYFKGRFVDEMNIFSNRQEVDGVYQSVSVHYKSPELKEKYGIWQGSRDVVGMIKPVDAEKLFYSILKGGNGWIHLNGFCIKKESLLRVGLFDEELITAQDIDLILRCALQLNIIPGSNLDKFKAARVIHGGNIIFDLEKVGLYRQVYSEKWFNLMLHSNWDKKINYFLFRNYIISQNLIGRDQRAKKYLFFLLNTIRTLITNPTIFKKIF